MEGKRGVNFNKYILGLFWIQVWI